MHILLIFLLVGVLTPVWGQPVMTITDSIKSKPVAPYAYFLEDSSHKLTYEQVSRFPLDSFKPINLQGAIQLGIRLGTVWIRLNVQNVANEDLFLFSSQWRYKRMDVYVLNDNGQLTVNHSEVKVPVANRIAPIIQPIIPVGRHPRTIHMALLLAPPDFFNDYLQLTDMGQAMRFQKGITFWQGSLTGVYLLAFLFALVFFLRLRDPLLGWYALFIFTSTHWFVDRSGYIFEIFSPDSWYFRVRSHYPIHLVFVCSWAIFLIKFTQLWKYSRFLYYLIIGVISVDVVDDLISEIMSIAGQHSFPRLTLFNWVGIHYIGYLAICLFFLQVCVVYVSIKDFRKVRWYALAFSIGLISMIIACLALYDISWLPLYPFNNFYFFGSFLEIIILGFVLAERTNQHRQNQNRTQQQLIGQLQENLRQKNKLLQIRDEIARDLHDEVGATLTSIAISTKLVQKKTGPERTEITPILEQIQTDSQDTIHTIRDTVWALNPDNDAPEKLFERMQTTGYQILGNQEIHLTFTNEVPNDQLPQFTMEQRRNIYFVYKEALHNIAKHAQATDADVGISQMDNELLIRISDNGTGFDPTLKREGNGLKNFQKRASDSGFLVAVFSKQGRGTTVEIQIPVRDYHDQSPVL